MAAPTSVRIEAQSMTTAVLYWSYSGTGDISVYRASDGASGTYAEVTTAYTRVVAGTVTYTDTGLEAGTQYWYKLSEDLGSNFSSVVTMTTHFCAEQNAGQAFSLPRFDEGQEDQSQRLNELAERVERALGDQLISPQVCTVCPEDGSVVIDCTDGCNSFLVIADQNINSFTINRCGSETPTINVYVPPSTTRTICGLPAGYGFTGDECNEVSISGGTNGRTVNFGGSGGGAGASGIPGTSTPGIPKTLLAAQGGSGGGVGGTECECVPGRQGQLALKCCTANCSLSCTGTQQLVIKVCGGVGPYTFEHTGSVQFKGPAGTLVDEVVSAPKSASPQVTVVPPTNSGSAVAGTAYRIGRWVRCTAGGGIIGNRMFSREYGCDDVAETGCTTNSANDNLYDSDGPCPGAGCCSFCGDGGAACGGTQLTATVENTVADCTGISCDESGGTTCDARTATMISDGCAPCGLQGGSVITVTDAAGVSVSITLQR